MENIAQDCAIMLPQRFANEVFANLEMLCVCVCVLVRACHCARAGVCVRVCVRTMCARWCVDVTLYHKGHSFCVSYP